MASFKVSRPARHALILALGLIPHACAAAVTNATTSCASLADLSFANGIAHVVLAVPLAAGSNFTGTTSESSYNTVQTDLPSLCRVALSITTSPNTSAVAEVWLPTSPSGSSQWNSRLLTVGNGGFAGGVNYPDLVWGVRKGFAAVSTNTGHNGSQLDGTWMLGNPEAEIDWGHRALHRSTAAAKEVVAVYYGQAQSWSYYAGCSTGGRQGLNAAERYPADYDGVLAGSAIAWQTHTSAWQTYVALQQFPTNRSSYIPSTLWPTIHAAVLAQCDDLDGLTDGIVMDPTKCAFRPQALLCGKQGVANASAACLNADQVRNLARMYEPWRDGTAENALVNPGLSPGGELGFASLMNGDTPLFGPTFYRYAVLNDTAWDWATTSVATVALADAINPGGCNAYDPDLRAFEARGAKIVQYHGFADPLIPSMNAPAWYDEINFFYEGLGRAADVESFYRLFMVPGMGHCSGGVGAWVLDGTSQGGYVPATNGSSHSMLYSLIEWVEGGSAGSANASTASAGPESVIGTKFVDDTPALGVEFTRPICRWPDTAVYLGTGNVSDAGNWACTGEGVY